MLLMVMKQKTKIEHFNKNRGAFAPRLNNF